MSDWQTQTRGSNKDEYEIYLSCTDDTPPKSFDEWLGNSDTWSKLDQIHEESMAIARARCS
jgi:hypothetical protein